MMRLAFSDLRDHAATWIGAFLVAVGCGYIGGWAVSIEASAETFDVLRSVGSVVIAFSSVAAVAVLALTANLTVDTQRRSYALWQLANMKPRLVSAVVLVQLVVVAVLGAICGTLLTTITFPPLFPWVFGARVEYAQAVPRVGAALMPFVWLAVAGTFLCGGLKGARSAGRTSPLAVLRESKPRLAGMTWMRVLLFAGLAIGAWQVAAIMIGSVPGVVMNWSLYLPILTTAGIAAVGPLAFAAILKAWTSVVPQSRWNAWYVARHTARFGLSASTSVETPIMVGFGLVAGIYSVMSIWADYSGQHGMTFTGLDWTAAILMLGGPVLLCAIGAAVSVVMTSKSRTRDVALLIAGGARPRTLLAAAACWRAWRPWPSPTSSPRTPWACRCSTGWLSARVWPSRSRASSSSSPRRSCPRSPLSAKNPQPSSRWGSESRGVSGLVFGGRLGRPATESGQQRKGQGGRECTLCTICRRFPL